MGSGAAEVQTNANCLSIATGNKVLETQVQKKGVPHERGSRGLPLKAFLERRMS